MEPRATLQDRIYTALSEDIARGELAPGTRLRVAHLAARFGTSQAPVREALQRLTEEGRAASVPYAGCVVREPAWDEIQDIYAMRSQLEAYAVARMLARRPTPSLSPLKRAVRELARAVRTGDEVQVIDADLSFHRTLLALAGSEVASDVWESLVLRFRGARLSLLRDHPDDLSTVVGNHEQLVTILEAGDPKAAVIALREHLGAAVHEFAERTGNSVAAGAFPW